MFPDDRDRRNQGLERAIKSMLMSVIVVSTALSPPLVGFMVERGDLGELLTAAVVTSVTGSLMAMRLWVGPTVDVSEGTA